MRQAWSRLHKVVALADQLIVSLAPNHLRRSGSRESATGYLALFTAFKLEHPAAPFADQPAIM